tara:strand:- start:357 stop:680 length:324 start_codon:yes stop_codon:yes gene_type:complete
METNHYYDKEMDNCDIHSDKETHQFYRIEMIIPIGMNRPHAGWRSAANWATKFIQKLSTKKVIEKEMEHNLAYRMSLGHQGLEDNRVCFKYFNADSQFIEEDSLDEV